MTRTTLLASLLILGAACTGGTVDPAVFGALQDAGKDGLSTQPHLQQRLVAFDGKLSTIEVWFEAAPGTKDNCIEVRSITLGGKAPIEALPLRLGPVAGGGRAEARFRFVDVMWREMPLLHRDGPVMYDACYSNELALSHAMVHATTSVTSNSRFSMGWVLRPDDPAHTLLASHFAKDR